MCLITTFARYRLLWHHVIIYYLILKFQTDFWGCGGQKVGGGNDGLGGMQFASTSSLGAIPSNVGEDYIKSEKFGSIITSNLDLRNKMSNIIYFWAMTEWKYEESHLLWTLTWMKKWEKKSTFRTLTWRKKVNSMNHIEKQKVKIKCMLSNIHFFN